MRLRPFRLVPVLAAVMLLLVPAFALAQDAPTDQDIAINSLLVFVGATLVLFMQAGFAMLEVGLSRMKNAGAVMGKILINLSITFLMFWAVGFAIGFGTGNDFIGYSGWFMDNNNAANDYASLAYSQTNFEVTFFFQVVFCAVSLAIVFGAMLDRTKFIGYIIFAIVLHRVHLPDRGALDVGRRLAPAERLPGLRRVVDRPPPGRPRGGRGSSGAGATHREVPRRQVRSDPGPLHPAHDPRRADPLGRLDGLQPGVLPQRHRLQLRRRRGQHQPGRGRRRHRRHDQRAAALQDARRFADGQRRPRRPGGDHRTLCLRGPLGRGRDRPVRRPDRPAAGARRREDQDRRPGRRPARARHGRHLGHARVWSVRRRDPRRDSRGGRGRPLHRGRRPPAVGPVLRDLRHDRVHLHAVPDRVPGDQVHRRPPRQRRGRAARSRHLRARDVRLPGALHRRAGRRVGGHRPRRPAGPRGTAPATNPATAS